MKKSYFEKNHSSIFISSHFHANELNSRNKGLKLVSTKTKKRLKLRRVTCHRCGSQSSFSKISVILSFLTFPHPLQYLLKPCLGVDSELRTLSHRKTNKMQIVLFWYILTNWSVIETSRYCFVRFYLELDFTVWTTFVSDCVWFVIYVLRAGRCESINCVGSLTRI